MKATFSHFVFLLKQSETSQLLVQPENLNVEQYSAPAIPEM